MEIGVIGSGSFGTALAILAAENNNHVTIFAREKEIVDSIEKDHTNPLFLPDIKLPTTLRAKSMDELFESNIPNFIWAIPSQFTREVAEKYHKTLESKSILIATKGIEISTGQLMLDVLKDVCTAKYSVLSGPSFAKELAMKRPTVTTIASFSSTLAKSWQEALSTDYFRTYTSEDMIGLEVGGSVKIGRASCRERVSSPV